MWPIGTPCRVADQPGIAFRITSTPHRPPDSANPDVDPDFVSYFVKSVDGEQGFYADEDWLSLLGEDEFCECGKIGCDAELTEAE